MSISSAYPYFLYMGLPVIILSALWRWFFYKRPVYVYSFLAFLQPDQRQKEWYTPLLFALRLLSLLTLCFALARLRVPDERTKIPVQGIDIMLVFDVSGSMQLLDDEHDPRSRLDVARMEGIKFIQKRENDPIGLVLFGGVAVSRAPLTLDKNILTQILKDTTIGIINPNETVLSRAIITAANRLKSSTAKSKIMIVLTDGQPTESDINPQTAIDLVKKLGIKIYTIGVGSEAGGWLIDPRFGLIRAHTVLNIPLLKAFADMTDGRFFQAHNPKELETIYQTIDKLETTEHDAPIFARYFEYFMVFLWGTLLLLVGEILIRSLGWRSL